MRRLHEAVILAASVAVLGTAVATSEATARDRRAQPPSRSRVIIEERRNLPPPLPPSSYRNYYGPAPGMQPPMQRVPPPAPLAQPPINR